MMPSGGFAKITAADFVVRSAYQMGKTPLLPIFAASLGAGEAFLGIIVSVSTVTGMVLKPLVGVLSDRWGRRAWLLVGTGFFAGVPFVYGFVDSPAQLFAVRVVHGLATAIYGPVTLAYVAELSGRGRAERLGWFSAARGAGYVIGPAAAGLMMLWMDPVSIFTVIGLVSVAAFLPVALLPESRSFQAADRRPLLRQAAASLRSVGKTPAVWIAGALNAKVLVALYASKAFLPLQAHSIGLSMAAVGFFFAAQEIVHMLLNPLGGRIGDRIGYAPAVALGMVTLGAALPLLTLADDAADLMAPAVLMGMAQALVFPSTAALVSVRTEGGNLGAGMGLVGAMRNAGKVAGPVLIGLLLHWLDFTGAFRLMGALLIVAGVTLWLGARYARGPSSRREVTEPVERLVTGR